MTAGAAWICIISGTKLTQQIILYLRHKNRACEIFANDWETNANIRNANQPATTDCAAIRYADKLFSNEIDTPKHLHSHTAKAVGTRGTEHGMARIIANYSSFKSPFCAAKMWNL